jgi:hypothetical protein
LKLLPTLTSLKDSYKRDLRFTRESDRTVATRPEVEVGSGATPGIMPGLHAHVEFRISKFLNASRKNQNLRRHRLDKVLPHTLAETQKLYSKRLLAYDPLSSHELLMIPTKIPP